MSARKVRSWSLIVTAEHGGNRVPSRWAPFFVEATKELESHRGWDPGALTLARRLAKRLGQMQALHATLITADVSRLVVDLNRSATNPRVFSEFTRPLSRPERASLLAKWHAPHRESVQRAVQAELLRGRVVLHLGVHSFTEVLYGVRRKPDLALLYDPSRPAERELARRWTEALALALPDLAIRRNDPYRGSSDGLTKSLRHAFAERSYLGFEIEVNQRHLGEHGHFPRRFEATLVDTLTPLLGTG